MSTYTLTEEQDQAVKGIEKWFEDQDKQQCTLVGYAGTGKTFLMDYIIRTLNLSEKQVAFAAFTGKAALVLKNRVQNYDCLTIHNLIYNAEYEGNELVFERKPKKDLKKLKLIVIDEASMVTEDIYNDLMSFGIPVIFIGDEGQLPPVGEKFNVLEEPDFKLTQVHRQAKNNPIIYLSMLARQGKKIELGSYQDKVLVARKDDINSKTLQNLYTRTDQIICGYNKTRKQINNATRELLGFKNSMPEQGDKIICLRNNWKKEVDNMPLINGMAGYVQDVKYDIPKKGRIKRNHMNLDFKPETSETNAFENLNVLNEDFSLNTTSTTLENYEHFIYDRFDYGYAITCHKSQGSQFNNVVVMNEVLNADNHHKWLYTAITRSSENLVLLI